MSAASSAEKSNTAQISGTPPQNPSTFTYVGSTSEWQKTTKEIRGGSCERGC